MTLIGQVETRYLQDGEEQGYPQAFRQRGEGHDDHGGNQLPAEISIRLETYCRKGVWKPPTDLRKMRRESSAHGSGFAAGTGMVQTIAEGGCAGDCHMGTGVGCQALSLRRTLGAPYPRFPQEIGSGAPTLCWHMEISYLRVVERDMLRFISYGEFESHIDRLSYAQSGGRGCGW